jgi:hypothetical protein
MKFAFFWGITQHTVVVIYRTFRNNVSVPFLRAKKSLGLLILENETDRLSRNVCKELHCAIMSIFVRVYFCYLICIVLVCV